MKATSVLLFLVVLFSTSSAADNIKPIANLHIRDKQKLIWTIYIDESFKESGQSLGKTKKIAQEAFVKILPLISDQPLWRGEIVCFFHKTKLPVEKKLQAGINFTRLKTGWRAQIGFDKNSVNKQSAWFHEMTHALIGPELAKKLPIFIQEGIALGYEYFLGKRQSPDQYNKPWISYVDQKFNNTSPLHSFQYAALGQAFAKIIRDDPLVFKNFLAKVPNTDKPLSTEQCLGLMLGKKLSEYKKKFYILNSAKNEKWKIAIVGKTQNKKWMLIVIYRQVQNDKEQFLPFRLDLKSNTIQKKFVVQPPKSHIALDRDLHPKNLKIYIDNEEVKPIIADK